MERRTLQTHRPQLIRAANDKPAKIAGYAARYFDPSDAGTEYELMRWSSLSVVERLMPGCFDRAVKEDDVRALYNHNADNLLGRSKSGTLRLFTDGKGLRYEIDPPDTQAARDLLESLKRGDVTGSSFSFDYLTRSDVEQRLPDGTEKEIIEVREVKLYDVGPVTFPAYASTTAEMRKANGGGFRWTPERRRRRVEQIEGELSDLDRSLAANAPQLSRRSRRERNNRVVAEIERDAIALMDQEIADARRQHAVCMARRK